MSGRRLTEGEERVVDDVTTTVDDMLHSLGERYVGTEHNLSAIHLTVGAFLGFIESQCAAGVPSALRAVWAARLISAAEMLLSQEDEEDTLH